MKQTEKNINEKSKQDNQETTLDKYEFLKEFAKEVEESLNEFNELTPKITEKACKHNIVIVNASDEDYITMSGIVTFSIPSMMFTQSEQSIKLDFDGTPLDISEKRYSKFLRCFRYCFGWSWLFKIDEIDYEIFNHKCNGYNWCQGIVFYLNDLEEEYINIEKIDKFGKICAEGKKLYPRTEVAKVDITYDSGEKETMSLCISDTTRCPIVAFKNNIYLLPWEDIVSLAVKSGLADKIRLVGENDA